MKKILLVILILFAAGTAAAQEAAEEPSDFLPLAPEPYRTDLPIVTFDTGNRLMMKALYPEYYASDYKVGREIRWINRNDSAFIAQWDSLGYGIMVLLEEYSGIKWREEKIDISLMRYLRTDVLYEPPCFPLEAIRMEDYTEAGPVGMHRLLNLIGTGSFPAPCMSQNLVRPTPISFAASFARTAKGW